MIETITVVVLSVTSLLLFAFGVNLLYLSWLATRLPKPASRSSVEGNEPGVCVQVPIYNERYVAERVLDSVCALDWPSDHLQVQVLDDSDDETVSIVAGRVAYWRARGIDVVQVRRVSRTGFKAGALAHGLKLTDAPLIAIFDADFVPPPDFLRRTIGAFDDPSIAFAQARWGHLDEGYSWFTRLQALAIDFHFLVEQSVRSARGFFTNFTGTAGVWRREAIVDAGGWSAATLTEDLDLSYRAQLRGWKAAYLEDLVVPEELPVSIDAYRRQQSRWATGSFQSAFKLLGTVLRSRNRAGVKLQATVHLLAYGVGPLMLVQLLCYPVLILTARHQKIPWLLADTSLIVVLVAVSPWFGFIVAQTRRGRGWWSGLPALLCQVVGAGMSLNTMIALVRALRPGGVFVRTPKHRIVQPGQEWRDQAYVRVGDPRALLEGCFGLGALTIVPLAVATNQQLLVVYAAMFGFGFLVVAGLSAIDFFEVLTLRSLGRRALSRVRSVTPVAGIFGLLSILFWVAAQMPEPFEDGYGHWLIAANLASTGSLHDPLFGMEDTWLPGYHVLAAALLRLSGLWQLDALKTLSAGAALATLALVYALAPSVRQSRVAVALLALNPIFLFTSGSAVVEPLLTALLTAAALAAVRGRLKLAALLAALACTTSTKAWIWVVAAAGFAILETLRRRAPLRSRLPAFAWAVPALAVLVFLQLGFAPATHSVTRGSVELMSATTRGSVPTGAFARLAEHVSGYGLAALPLFVFGVVGAVVTARQHNAALWRFLYVPAAAYLGSVLFLVSVGAYSGSHRYLYPALPALALLAAAALDRYASVVRLVAVGSTGLLAVAFLPVFSSFAASNAGLVAAGRATQGSPGLLVTDSPLVAFYSGKRISDITGSQFLPGDRSRAIDWLRSHGAAELVLEDISYYRATEVFPDLSAGRTAQPFVPLGDQNQYHVSGGKPVYAYRLPPALMLGDVSQGKTAPLAKGVTLGPAGTGEGVGFGVPIVHYPDGWVYSRTATAENLSTPTNTIWRRTYELDTIGGNAAHRYQFVPIASRGAIEVTYVVDAAGILISVRALSLTPGYTEVGILNEQSAAFDDFAADHQPTLIGAAFGNWYSITGEWARLRSGTLGLEFSAPRIAGAELHAGRELNPPDFNWAGLDYIFPASFVGAAYHINLQEAR